MTRDEIHTRYSELSKEYMSLQFNLEEVSKRLDFIIKEQFEISKKMTLLRNRYINEFGERLIGRGVNY